MPMSRQVAKYAGSVKFRKINWKCETKGLVTLSERGWVPMKQKKAGSVLGVASPSNQRTPSCTGILQQVSLVRSL